MDEGRLQKKIMKWKPKGWKKDRLKLIWMHGIQNRIQKGP